MSIVHDHVTSFGNERFIMVPATQSKRFQNAGMQFDWKLLSAILFDFCAIRTRLLNYLLFIRGTRYDPVLSACLSSQCCIERDERIKFVFFRFKGFLVLSTHPTLCYKEIRKCLRNNDTSVSNFFPNSWLGEDFIDCRKALSTLLDRRGRYAWKLSSWLPAMVGG